uniref:Uncharacterized protein n=1 Tax=Spongospora subterranea TaxID=70186 RepID=A0A0H5R978_9EUKA|eukprot:CRZ04959.1 hypothetical protein [Spongospora subterranea]
MTSPAPTIKKLQTPKSTSSANTSKKRVAKSKQNGAMALAQVMTQANLLSQQELEFFKTSNVFRKENSDTVDALAIVDELEMTDEERLDAYDVIADEKTATLFIHMKPAMRRLWLFRQLKCIYISH